MLNRLNIKGPQSYTRIPPNSEALTRNITSNTTIEHELLNLRLFLEVVPSVVLVTFQFVAKHFLIHVSKISKLPKAGILIPPPSFSLLNPM